MNTERPGIPGRSAKSATDENGGSAESLTAAPEGEPGPARPAGPALAAKGGGSGCGGLGPPQLRQPLPVWAAQERRPRLPPRPQARPQGPGPGGRGTYEGTPGVYTSTPGGPPRGSPGRRRAVAPLPPHASGLVSLPLAIPLVPFRRALAIAAGPRRPARHEGPRVPRTPARGVVVGALVGRAGGPVPRPTAGDVGKVGNYTPGRKGKMNGPPIGPGGRPCPPGWVRWPAAAVVGAVGRGAGPPSRCPGGFARVWPGWLAWGCPAGRIPEPSRSVKGQDERPTVGLWAALDRPGAPW